MTGPPPLPPGHPVPGQAAPWTTSGPVPGGPLAGPSSNQAPLAGYYPPPAAYGTNGFAIVALVCALAGAFPFAVIFGIVSLRQLRQRPQGGRGMAIAGLVLGSLATLLVVGIIVAAIITSPGRDSHGRVISAGTQSLDHLKVGDCFNGVKEGRASTVTAVPCGAPHEAEVGAVVTLPDTPFPGADKAAAMTEDQCVDALHPLVREDRYDEVDLFYVYPDSAFTWKADRTGTCIVIGLDGRKLSGSVLQTTGTA